jgi:phosphoserine phosphatase RsbU/P
MAETKSDPEIHPLLLRQLKRAGVDVASLAGDRSWTEVVRRISRTYYDHDDSRYLRERSLELSSREMQELNARLAEERKRLQGELEIARSMQVSILPRDVRADHYEVAGRMVPATEVGGDYFDVIPVKGGCWVGIGDVAGHGLRAAVIMTMVQSMTAALIRQNPGIAPRDVIIPLNQAVRDNVFRRLSVDNHVTFTLLHCRDDGRVTFAGAHEAILVHRAERAGCEEIPTPGTWLGPLEDIAPHTIEGSLQLGAGDLMVLYTDGVTEARNARKEQFGIAQLASCVSEHHANPIGVLGDQIIARVQEWARVQEDDVSVLLYRQLRV